MGASGGHYALLPANGPEWKLNLAHRNGTTINPICDGLAFIQTI